eukprot:CAMPEP_0183748290 /NCGR_PEP_ID=MMETSP0737-20130205/67695_1 /TAXON_ID=385413 /ORGANISM="Thalassiosira miniscula, Strain CCMP1093" /LENGTH=46 /DNA_ID= /DNA_START= /DNA_END= /DNA_ORIENTATION=
MALRCHSGDSSKDVSAENEEGTKTFCPVTGRHNGIEMSFGRFVSGY